MDREQFWSIIQSVQTAAPQDMEKRESLLKEELQKLDAETIVAFQNHWDRLSANAYTWDLWAAAFIIQGGCSDDSFMDFISCLISEGKKAYEDALQNPETLASVIRERNPEDMFYECIQYVPAVVYEEKTGEEWDEDTVDHKYPGLAQKFGC